MAKRLSVDERLAAVSRTRREPLSAASIEILRDALADKRGVLIEHAARAAAELLADPLVPDLIAAFDRCLHGQVDDRSLLATTALADALQALRADAPDLYLLGLKLRKPIPPHGDGAAGVRCACAFGLVRARYHDDLWELATLLHDPILECRIAAARAMAMAGSPAALPLLKFKVLSGDVDIEVIVECLSALMAIHPALALPFVAAHLDAADDRLAEAAALALGESRRPEALPPLQRAVPSAPASLRRILLLSIGLLRTDAAIAYLLDRIAHADPRTAADAVAAMALYRQDSGMVAKLKNAVEANGAKGVKEAFASEFK